MKHSLFLRGGTFYVNAVLPDGQRLKESTGHTDRNLADAEAQRIVRERTQRQKAGGMKTLRQGFDKMWLKGEKWHDVREREGPKQRSEAIMVLLGPEFPVDKVTTAVLNDVRERLLAVNDRTEATVQRYMHAFTAMLRQAVEKWGWINFVPTYHKLKKAKTCERALKDDEVVALLEAEHRPEFHRLWVWLLDTGCRLGESLKLTWADVDFKAAVVTFPGTITKTGESKMLPLSPDQVLSLRKAKLAGSIRPFPINRNTAQVYFYKTRDKAGLDKSVHIHVLRHTCATRILATTGNLKLAQAQLGHSDIGTTQRYAKADVSQLASLAGWASKLVK